LYSIAVSKDLAHDNIVSLSWANHDSRQRWQTWQTMATVSSRPSRLGPITVCQHLCRELGQAAHGNNGLTSCVSFVPWAEVSGSRKTMFPPCVLCLPWASL
jgi:hypothetical protein